MENTKKITKAQRFEDIIALIEGNEPAYGTTPLTAIDVLRHEIELCANKNQKRNTTKPEDERMLQSIRDILAGTDKDSAMTVTEIFKRGDFPNSQKVTSLVKKLVDANEIVKESDKGRSKFHGLA
jgi:predicted transcriptional regulator